mmetsp:Transcript_135255/g.320593  ORF Transcript_135255/g.320593 Transcript_135255/m.320593 type:complete len:230 (-) Transcript_135255:384-1073(-)
MQAVHQHTAAPNVHFLGVLPRHDLGRHVEGGAYRGLELLPVPAALRQAEVDELQGGRVHALAPVQEDIVLRLEISMNNILAVAVGDGRKHLLHHLPNDGLCEVLLLHQAIKELPALAKLHDQVKVATVLIHRKEPDDVGMIHLLRDLDLAAEMVNIRHAGLHDELDRSSCPRLLVAGPPYSAKAALAQLHLVDLVSLLNVRGELHVNQALAKVFAGVGPAHLHLTNGEC